MTPSGHGLKILKPGESEAELGTFTHADNHDMAPVDLNAFKSKDCEKVLFGTNKAEVDKIFGVLEYQLITLLEQCNVEKIRVRMPNGAVIRCEFHPSDTLDDLENKLQAQGILKHSYEFYLKDAHLYFGKPLGELGVHNGCQIEARDPVLRHPAAGAGGTATEAEKPPAINQAIIKWDLSQFWRSQVIAVNWTPIRIVGQDEDLETLKNSCEEAAKHSFSELLGGNTVEKRDLFYHEMLQKIRKACLKDRKFLTYPRPASFFNPNEQLQEYRKALVGVNLLVSCPHCHERNNAYVCIGLPQDNKLDVENFGSSKEHQLYLNRFVSETEFCGKKMCEADTQRLMLDFERRFQLGINEFVSEEGELDVKAFVSSYRFKCLECGQTPKLISLVFISPGFCGITYRVTAKIGKREYSKLNTIERNQWHEHKIDGKVDSLSVQCYLEIEEEQKAGGGAAASGQ